MNTEFEKDLRRRSITAFGAAFGLDPSMIENAEYSQDFADQIEQNQICDEINEKDNFPDGPNEGSVYDDVKKPYWYEYRGGRWIKKDR